MKRSAGVTAAASVALLGSAFVFLFSAFAGLGLLLIRLKPPSAEAAPRPFGFLPYVGLLTMVGFAAWGVATGIGLIRLRPWARTSTLVVAGLLLAYALPAAPMFILMRHMGFPPDEPPGDLQGVFFVLLSICGILAGIALWWLILFTRPAVRAQFTDGVTPALPISATEPAFVPPLLETPKLPHRPILISVLGWYFIIAGATTLFFSFFSWPAAFLGRVLTGWPAHVFHAGGAALFLLFGLGLLQLRPLARRLCMVYQIFVVANGALAFLKPGFMKHLLAAMSQFASLPPQMQLGMEKFLEASKWYAFTWAFIFPAAIVWLLMHEKAAFESDR